MDGKLLRRNINGRPSLAEGQARRDKDFNPLSPAEDFVKMTQGVRNGSGRA